MKIILYYFLFCTIFLSIMDRIGVFQRLTQYEIAGIVYSTRRQQSNSALTVDRQIV